MPIPTPFHPRTAPLCTSFRWKDWAGHAAVCRYDTAVEPEYFALRQSCGLLDVSPLEKCAVRGRDAGALLARVATRDIGRLAVGRVTYTCFCDDDGKVIDDGTVARLEDGSYRVTAASPLCWWLERNAAGFAVEIENRTEAIAALALQGPTSRAVLEAATGAIVDLRFFGLAQAMIGGIEVEITRTGYSGDLGYEVWLPAEHALAAWDALCAAGAPFGMLPAGLDALDMARVEAAFVLQGVDYFSAPRCLLESRKSTPLELGLDFTVQLEREPFLGQRALRAEQARGPAQRLIGLEIDWPELEHLYDQHGLPPQLPAQAWRTAVPVFRHRRQVGQATSGTWSPILKRNVALAAVRSDCAGEGTELRIEHTVEYERHTVAATVVPRPFYDPPRKRA